MTDTYTDTAAPDEAAPAPVADGASSDSKTYAGDRHGIEEAAADRQRHLDENKKAEPSPQRIAKAKQTVAQRVAAAAGVEAVDLDVVEWGDKDKKNLRELEASKALAKFRADKEAAINGVLAEEDAAVADEQAATRAHEEWQQQQAAQEREWEATQEHQRQQQVSEQTRQLSETEYAFRSRLQQYSAAALAELPELPQLVQLAQTNPGQAQQLWAALAVRDPGKVARIQQLDAAYRADAAQAELASVHQHQQQQATFQEYGRAEDAKFKAAHPEVFADRRAQFEAQQDVVEYLVEKRGLTEARLRQLWTSDPMFRSAEAQGIILDAARQYRTEKMRKEIRPVTAPPPQRPGTSTGRVGMNGTGGENTLRAIDAAGTTRKQIAAARDLLVARRRATARTR